MDKERLVYQKEIPMEKLMIPLDQVCTKSHQNSDTTDQKVLELDFIILIIKNTI